MAENRNADAFDDLIKGYRALKLRIIRQCAAQALAFFKASFTNQGFTDNNLVKWDKRIGGPNNKRRAIGVNRGILKRGVRIKSATVDGAIVGVDEAIPYAETFNYGGKIKITPQMRRFFWAMYYQYGGKIVYNVRTKAAANTKKNEQLNDVAQFYKNLAITKEQFITIPARQFIGDSATLEKQLFTYVTGELDKFFKIDEY